MNGPLDEMELERTDLEPTLPEGELAVAARTLVEERLRGVRRAVDRDLAPVDIVIRSTEPSSRSYLFEEACELYWNELNWEELTEEEKVSDGSLTEMVFPGLLAFLDALLPRAPNGEPDRDRERRDVAHDFLLWLAARLVRLRNERPDDQEERFRQRREANLTDELVDLVVHRLYGLTSEEIDAARSD